MLSIEEKKKELERLEAALRNLRLTQHNLESDIKKAQHEHNTLLETISNIRADIKKERDKKSKLDQECSCISAEAKEYRRQVSYTESELKKEHEALDAKVQRYTVNKEQLDKQTLELKKQERLLQQNVIEFNHEKSIFERDKKAIEGKQADNALKADKELENAKHKALVADQKLSTLENKIDNAKRAEQIYIQKKQEIEKAEEQAKQSKARYDTALKATEDEQLNLQKP